MKLPVCHKTSRRDFLREGEGGEQRTEQAPEPHRAGEVSAGVSVEKDQQLETDI